MKEILFWNKPSFSGVAGKRANRYHYSVLKLEICLITVVGQCSAAHCFYIVTHVYAQPMNYVVP